MGLTATKLSSAKDIPASVTRADLPGRHPAASVSSAFVASPKRRTRAPRLIAGPVAGLAALAAALTVAGCTSAPAPAAQAADASARTAAAPAITAAQAGQVWDRYLAASTAAGTHDDELLAAVTGVQRTVLATALGRHPVVITGTAAGPSSGAYHSTLEIRLGYPARSYGRPVFYLPERAAYPRFFVASAVQTLSGTAAPGRQPATPADGASVPADGTALLMFEQASAGARWLLASSSELAAGQAVPKLATDRAGYTPVVWPAAAALLAPPGDVGPLQAAVVDDGPASAAARVVASGPLTTGLYQDAVSHSGGLTAPPGDHYQWELSGTSYPEFALRTAAGGALVFYAMTLTTTVAVPGYLGRADPVRSGLPIQVPAMLLPLLPAGQGAPLVQLSSGQLLSFAAIDPAPGTARVRVIAMGGGLVSASAS